MRSPTTRRLLETIPAHMDAYGQFDVSIFRAEDRMSISYLVNGSYVKRVNGSKYALTRYGRNYLARHQLIEPTRKSRRVKRDGYSVFEMKVPTWGL